VEALGEIGGETAVLVLQQAMADEQSYIREAAAQILTEMSSKHRLGQKKPRTLAGLPKR